MAVEHPLLEDGRRADELCINGHTFKRIPFVKYPSDYHKITDWIQNKEWDELSAYRHLVKTDLFFILYFVMGMKNANHPWVIERCKEIAKGPASMTLDIWAREHLKSSLFTCAEVIQKVLNDSNQCVCIFSHTRAAAKKFLRQIKAIFETSDLLKACFPDVLYQKPETEAFKWSEDEGLWLKRTNQRKEATIEAWGLIEGMPTGSHFTHRVYDDVETQELVNTPELMAKVKEQFDLSENCGSEGDTQRIVGTYYDYTGPLMYIRDKTLPNGEKVYTYRVYPATEDGTPTGKPVLISQGKLDRLRTNPKTFYAQQLCDPAPMGTAKLNFDYIKTISPNDLPAKLFKFMVVDPAGMRTADSRGGDAWGIMVIGVEPYRDELGASNIYILDMVIEPLDEVQCYKAVVDMYCKHGRINKLGIEKVGLSSTEVHIMNALRARGRHVTVENGMMEVLRPAGRRKEYRIEQSLVWPLNNGKIHLLSSIPNAYRDRLRQEMLRFPVWHDDGIDALSYVYDMIKDYRFGEFRDSKVVKLFDNRRYRRGDAPSSEGWLAA